MSNCRDRIADLKIHIQKTLNVLEDQSLDILSSIEELRELKLKLQYVIENEENESPSPIHGDCLLSGPEYP